jgi:hypothetical protein
VPRAPPRWDGWPLCFTSRIAAPSPGFTGLRVSSPNPGFRKQLATRRSCSVHTELVVGTPSSLCCNFLVTGSDCSQRPRARPCTAPSVVCTAGPSFFAAAIGGISLANAGYAESHGTLGWLRKVLERGVARARFSSLRVHEGCL